MPASASRSLRYAYLGEVLVSQGLLSASQVELAVEEQKRRGERLGRILIDLGFCSEAGIAGALARQLGLEQIEAVPELVDSELVGRVGATWIREKLCLPVVISGRGKVLAVADPFDIESTDLARHRSGIALELIVATPSSILSALDGHSTRTSETEEVLGRSPLGSANLGATAELSIERLVEALIRDGARLGSSDVHIEPEANVLRVRFRVDGVLTPGPVLDKEMSQAVAARIKVLASLDLGERRLAQDGRCQLQVDGQRIDLRISVLPTVYGENIVLRLLDSRRALVEPTKLGMRAELQSSLLELAERPHGLIVVCGPTGSGKSTTLYSLLSTIDGVQMKIATVEDPVELRLPFVRQVQTHAEIGMTFGAALRSILRQDPDVILVGETRDLETAQISVRAALTGHLVFTSLHTNTACGAIPRLIDMGVDAYLVKSSLIGALSQRLIRKICNKCREEYQPDEQELRLFAPSLRGRVRTLWRGRGCKECRGSGCSGRTTIHELLKVTNRVRILDFAKVSEEELLAQARTDGFTSLSEDAQMKVIDGLLSITEAERVVGRFDGEKGSGVDA